MTQIGQIRMETGSLLCVALCTLCGFEDLRVPRRCHNLRVSPLAGSNMFPLRKGHRAVNNESCRRRESKRRRRRAQAHSYPHRPGWRPARRTESRIPVFPRREAQPDAESANPSL